ncbi:MAG: ABC transporter permease, partial [Acetobacteraceae bacterium]
LQVLGELILPGALAQIILGLRTSMAYGWRALVAAEMIAGTNGLGFRMIEAVQWYQTDTVLVGMIVIGVLWIVFDGVFFAPLERATVRRWGLLREVA